MIEILLYFLKSFCKNIRRFENFTLLTSICRWPWQFRCCPWAPTGSEVSRRGPRRLATNCRALRRQAKLP
jgi:hypothetical protein